jgi:predicted NACHT family NTPase
MRVKLHDVFRYIREQLAQDAQARLREKLNETPFLAPTLEQGVIPEAQLDEWVEEEIGLHRRRWRNLDLDDFLRHAGWYKWVISADAGTGKTTLLLWLAKELVAKTEFVPLFLRCRNLEDCVPHREVPRTISGKRSR